LIIRHFREGEAGEEEEEEEEEEAMTSDQRNIMQTALAGHKESASEIAFFD